ncbi:hypothetical protein BW727_200010 (plasmid) [Jeotgalibaca dankookensis]|uniref:Initiator Rep protein WH1 domain-containing protein n=1 Tax=Jeotgalibaca dankookensis TaxID=708126 RepID=A0A1S6IS84_9LACT|nr:replication initiation protein [Jeotgalibaca dankookensis]AQS54413.1 hypothetical protein BW727_200010 [Jeotgalibaca dankookensis]
MNEVTRYHNELNTIPMREWTTEEQNFFFAIITEARDKGEKMIHFKKEDLIELANYTMNENRRLENTIVSLIDKLENMRYRERTKNSYTSMALFQYFEANWSDNLSEFTLDVQVSNRFAYIVNKLEAEFTQFELRQFTNIRSTYAKEMFKKLKQWRTIGKKEYSIEEFKEMLQIPKSYRTREISTRVLAPIKRELPEYFKNLKIKTIKSSARGNPVIAYEFRWEKEKIGTWVPNKYNQNTHNYYSKRIEKLPEWATNEYIQKEDTLLPPDQQALYQERLKRIRENKPK